jgi:hypothetical protein
MSRRQQDAGEPRVRITAFAAGEAKYSLDVKLKAGQSICAARDPLFFSEGLVFSPVAGGMRWVSPGEGELCFGADGADVAKLEVAKGPYLVATELVVLWTDGVRLQREDVPGVPGFARTGGEGQLWVLLPGEKARMPLRVFGGQPDIVVDPARLAWARVSATPAPQRVTLTRAPVLAAGCG